MSQTGAGRPASSTSPSSGSTEKAGESMAGESKATFVTAEGWAGLSGDLAPVL